MDCTLCVINRPQPSNCASIDRFWHEHITDGHMFILCFYWQVLTWTHHGRTHVHFVLLLTGFDMNTLRTNTCSFCASVDQFWREHIPDGHMFILCFYWQVLTWTHHGRTHVHSVLLLISFDVNTSRTGTCSFCASIDRFWHEHITDGHMFILCFYWQVLTWTHYGRTHVHFVLLLISFDVNTSRTGTCSFCVSIDRFWREHITDNHMFILCFYWQVLTWTHHGRAHVHFVLFLDMFWREHITHGYTFILCFYWQVLTWTHHGRTHVQYIHYTSSDRFWLDHITDGYMFVLCFCWQVLTWTHHGRAHVHFVLLLSGFDVNTSRTGTCSFCASIDRFWRLHITDGHNDVHYVLLLAGFDMNTAWTHTCSLCASFAKFWHEHITDGHMFIHIILLTGFDVNTSRTGTGSTGGSSRGSSSSGHHSDLINQLGDAGDVKQFLSSEVGRPWVSHITMHSQFLAS